MAEFQLPSDGSVLILDDKIEHAMPLIKLLSKNGIATSYFSGNDDEFPAHPVQKIRLAFVDIQLFGPSDSHSYAQNILRILDRVISDQNGPYILVIWSTLEKVHADTLEGQVTSENYLKRPVIVLRLEKSTFFHSEIDSSFQDEIMKELDETFSTRFTDDDLQSLREFIEKNIPYNSTLKPVDNALQLLAEELKTKLNNANSFHLFTIWEKLINAAAGEIVKSYSSLHPTDEFWEDNLKYSIYRMAHAQLGKTVDKVQDDELLKNAIKTLNHTFLDAVENKMHVLKRNTGEVRIDRNNIFFSTKIDAIEYKIKWRAHSGRYQLYINGALFPINHKGETDINNLVKKGRNPAEKEHIKSVVTSYESIKPEINKRLLIDVNGIEKYIQPGNLYEKIVSNWRRRQSLLKHYFKKSSDILEADGKFKLTNQDLKKIRFIELEVTPLCDFVQEKWIKSRLLPGILVPEEFVSSLLSPDSFYSQIPIIRIEDINYKPLFDFRLLKSVDIEKDKNLLKKPLFRVRSELFADILSRLSSHISRIGISYIE